jgi:glycerophosphoryl diester phosphodiesterase
MIMKYQFFAVLVGFYAMIASASGPLPEIVAHRGESHDAPENTIAAFKLAWERNDDIIELDVHLTKDGKAIICHDADTKRTCGPEYKIKDTMLDVLRKLDAGSWKGPQWKDEKLPLLDEVLKGIPSGKKCFVEIKVGPEAVPAVAQSIHSSGKKRNQFVIISFNPQTIAAAKKQMPDIPAFFL